MKFGHLVILLISLSTVQAYSQCGLEEDIIKDIRNKFTRINSNKSTYEVYASDAHQESVEDDEPVRWSYDSVFLDNGQLRLIVNFHSNSYWSSNSFLTEYYFWNDKLFFIYKKEVSIDRIQPECNSTGNCPAKANEERFYFCDTYCIQYLTKEVVDIERNIYSSLLKSPNDKGSCYDIHKSTLDNAYRNRDDLLIKLGVTLSNGR